MKAEQYAKKKGYKVDKDGNIYNPDGKRLTPVNDGRDYLKINLRIDGKHKQCRVHRLQALQKYGNRLYKKGIEVRHLDGNSLNNSWDNIAIGTHSQNMMDLPKEERVKRAYRATSFVRKYDKDEVRSYHKESKSYKLTMEKFGITSKGTLAYILKG